MSWTFGLTALDGTAIGAITRAYDRRLNLVLNGLPTASVRLRLDDPLVEEITSRDGDVLLKVWGPPNDFLHFIGDLTTLEEVSRAEENKPPSVVCNFAGPLWRLQKRLAGKAAQLSPVAARSQIAWDLIETTNAESDTGIRQGTIGATANATAGPWRYKPIAEALAEMAAAEIYPFEPGYLARDDFGFDGALAGRQTLGGTWVGVGDADDLIGTGTTSELGVARSTVSDTFPRIDHLSYDYDSVTVEVALRTSDPAVGSALGVVARQNAADPTNDYLLCYLFPSDGRVKLEKRIGGVQTLIGQTTPGVVTAGQFYVLRLWVDTAGNYKVWFALGGAPDMGAPYLSGSDAALHSTTGSLKTGRVGIYDHNPTATTHTRTYDAFWAAPARQRRDDFGFAGNLNGRALPTEQTWGGAGSGGDFTGQGSTSLLGIQRTNPGDGENTGRYAPISGTVTGPVYVQTAASVDVGPYLGKLGVLARYTDTNNWVMATMDPGSTDGLGYAHISVRKRVGGTATVLGTSGPVQMNAIPYNIRLAIDATGNWAVWWWPDGVSDPAAPILTGTDAQLAAGSGASIESGQVGIYDANFDPSGLTVTRAFDAVFSDTNTQTLAWQTVNFELAPLDIGIGGETDVAAFNASETIGTTKDVVFEYGGNRAIRSYRRVLSREGLLNQAISLPNDFPVNTDVRVKSDGGSISTRGLFEEVLTSDIGDSSLREALAAAHVAIRKDPRQLITFEPSSTAPEFGTDYIVGDIVTGRATAQGTVRFNGLFRIYQVEVVVDDNGKVTIQPTLIPE